MKEKKLVFRREGFFKALVVLESAKFRVIGIDKVMTLSPETEVVAYVDKKGKAYSFEGGLLENNGAYKLSNKNKQTQDEKTN